MMPRQRRGFPGGMPGRNYQPGMYPGQMMGVPPMMGGMSQGPQKRSGGLLSKILGNKRGPQAPSNTRSAGTGAAAGGSLLKTLGDPSTISSFLNNTQQMIKTAQTIGPVVQQYGPMVKNIPAMWKLYKGLKSSPTETDTVTAEVKEEVKVDQKVELSELEEASLNIIPIETELTVTEEVPPIVNTQGQSKPKMYI